MVDDSEGEISVRGSPALTAEFFYVMRGMLAVASCQKALEQATTLAERRQRAAEGRAALRSLSDSFERIPELLNELHHSPDAVSMFTQTLVAQAELYEDAKARFEATLSAYGLGEESA